MPMTILKICTSRAWGGMEMSAVASCTRLRRRGHAVLPVCGPDSPIHERLVAGGFEPLVANLWGKVHPLQARRLGAAIRDRRVDIVHCDWSRDLFTVVPALGGAPWVPLVLHKHVGVIRPKRLPVHVWLYRRVDHVIAISEVIRHNFVAMHPIAPEKVSVLHHGVDLARFRRDPSWRERVRAELGAAADMLLVGIVGRVTPAKGHLEFLEMARRLAAEDPRVRFVIAGEATRGEEAEGRAILERIEACGLRDRVIVTGFRDDVPELLNALDLFVFPSRAEAFGLALVEAMAVGLPTVSTDCDGVVDIVVAGETGLMVPPRDPERLAAAVRSLLADPGRRRRMGEAGADRVRHRFSEERMDADLEILYTRLVAERAARRR
jgi:glycosyltransferase involved in cell wall biosynthesis